MNPKLKENIRESLASVLPISLIVLLVSVILVPMELGHIMLFLTGAVMLIIGMGLFQLGAEMTMTPLGEGIGVQLSKMKTVIAVLVIGFLMGVIITVSEPDLQVLAEQVPGVPNMILIIAVAVGVGLFLAISILRIRDQISLSGMLIVLYTAVIILAFFVPKNFVAVAFDSGGVTTGPMTVPFIMAMGVGLASVRSDKNAESDSFGLVALSSVGPILAVMTLGCFFKPDKAEYSLTDIESVNTTRDVVKVFLKGLPQYAEEVFVSLVPIVVVFIIFQIICRRYRGKQILKIVIGLIYTYSGLVLFLCGVNLGFAPVGAYLGGQLAEMSFNWLLIPIGMLIGYYIVKAEPAIQILNHQVQSVTDGAISVKVMNRCMSIGVSVSVGLAMLRILTGMSIMWILIPGYVAALVLSRIVPKLFVGIAFDSGGVASGPMTSTFLLPLSIGACSVVGGNVMTDAFGVVALVALTPLVAIQIMGVLYKIKMHKKMNTTGHIEIPVDSDEIIDLEEGMRMEGAKRPLIRFLGLIMTEKLSNMAIELFEEEGVALKHGLLAEGTASSEILDMMGLGSTEKRFLATVLPKKSADKMLGRLNEKLELRSVNSGIAFSIPVNGLNSMLLKIVSYGKEELSGPAEEECEKKGENENMSERKHVLIAALINRGFSSDVMVAAREVGAGGGTVLHSRQIISEETAGLWGIGIQEEKEILLIISDSEHKMDIMKAISEKCGIHSEAGGMVMSLPIDTVIGI